MPIFKLFMAVTIALTCAGCSSQDRCAPLAEVPFFFHQVGATTTLTVIPKLFTKTEIAIINNGNALPIPTFGPPQKFSWRITATALRHGKILETIVLRDHAWWHAEDKRYYKSVSLGSFEKIGVIPQKTQIVLKVEAVDPKFSAPNQNLKIAVRASPVP